MRTFDRRIAKLEAANAPPVRPYSGRVVVGMNETVGEATARHVAQFGKPPRRVPLFAMPAKPRTVGERAEWERQFHKRQVTLIGNARRERIAAPSIAEPAAHFPVGIGTPVPPRFHVPVRWQRN